MLGYRTLSVFTEFLLKMETTDPSERIRLYRIRTEAIATSVSRVLADGERLLSGWTLLSPAELNARITGAFQEKVVILVCGVTGFLIHWMKLINSRLLSRFTSL